MVMGYMCEEHGLQDECDVSDAGERLCEQCGNAVTGLSGTTRGRKAPPSDEPMHQSGQIRWDVLTGYSGEGFTVSAFDFKSAVEVGVNRVENPQEIREVRPSYRQYRNF